MSAPERFSKFQLSFLVRILLSRKVQIPVAEDFFNVADLNRALHLPLFQSAGLSAVLSREPVGGKIAQSFSTNSIMHYSLPQKELANEKYRSRSHYLGFAACLTRPRPEY
jgi:hypothetical protein